MIITNVIGGLGNQMFQYACGRALSLRLNRQLLIATDQFKNYNLHNGFELPQIFSIDCEIASQKNLYDVLGWRKNKNLRRVIARFEFKRLAGKTFVSETHNQFLERTKNLRNPLYLHGYWQSEKYFEAYSDIIRSDFKFLQPMGSLDSKIRKDMKAGPSVSVHVRRGDYTNKKNSNYYALCGLEYYKKAIQYILKKSPKAKLFIFSDDPKWVRNNLMKEFHGSRLIEHNRGKKSYNDLRLMSQTTHHVIANSSFSWWGAWLNPNDSKIVVAPSLWFAAPKTNFEDIVPKKWIRV